MFCDIVLSSTVFYDNYLWLPSLSTMYYLPVLLPSCNVVYIFVLACCSTVGFTLPTLGPGQTNNIDYILDNLLTELPSIVNQNNPVLLVQYVTSILNFLNDQSAAGVGNVAVRAALRDVIATSLSGLPLRNIYFIQQMSNAIELLAVSYIHVGQIQNMQFLC